MWDTNGRKIKRFLVWLNWKKKKSGQKYKKAIEWYIDILKKEEKNWETKWTMNTKQRALARIKKYGITREQIENSLEHKGLNNLVSKVNV